MPNIENISVRTTTKKPNGAIIGTLTNNNGVLSGFGTYNFFEIPNGRQTNATYVMKFTTPSTAPTSTTDILHIENWECIEQDASVINTYNWELGSGVTLLSNPSANTTYWIKSVHSGTTRTYYISTNGESYSQVASFSDSGLNVNFDSPSIIGNISLVRLQSSRAYAGSIDLNGCYIEVGGAKVWQGMDYNDIQKVGGNEFDGQWVLSGATINSNFTLEPGGSQTMSLASYLPNDGCDYEVMFECRATTGSTSGNTVESYIYSGSNTTDYVGARTARIRTRASGTQVNTVTVVLPIKASNKNCTVFSHATTSTGTGSFGVWVRGYRRIGKNGTGSNYISSIEANGNNYDISGKFLNGDWIYKSSTLYNTTLANSGSATLSLSSYLPNDGYAYWVMFSVYGTTGSTSGNTIAPRLGANTGSNNAVICQHVTRTSSTMSCGGNTLVPVATRNVYLYNSGNASGTINVIARGYRRIGTNG